MSRRTLIIAATLMGAGMWLGILLYADHSRSKVSHGAHDAAQGTVENANATLPPPPKITCGTRTTGIFYGINGHVQQGGAYSESSFDLQLAQLRELGATIYRQDVSDAEGARTVSELARAAQSHCIGVLAVLTPATQSHKDEAAAYADGYSLGRTAAMILKGAVSYYQVGNELEIDVIHAGASGNEPADYDNTKFKKARGSLLGMIAGVKEIDPSAKIVLSALGWIHYGFSDMLHEGSQPDGTRGHPIVNWDITAWHWYSDMGSITAAGDARTNVLEHLRVAYGKPIWITEFGVRPDYKDGDAGSYLTGNEALAGYVANAKTYGIQSVVLYELYDDLRYGGDGNYGLINDDGKTRKPLFETVRNFIAKNQMP